MSSKSTLRTTSDALVRDLAALSALEDEKRSLPFDDPRLLEIAEQVQAIAARVLDESTLQTTLAREVAREPADATSIEDVRRPLAAILAEWREVERRAAEAPEGSAEEAEARILASRLREEYAKAYRRADEAP